MLERKRAALVAVALETRSILATDVANARCRQAAVRIMTVAAVDGARSQLVCKGAFEACSHCGMAARTEIITRSPDVSIVDAMAAVTTDAVPRVRRFKS